MNKDRVILIKRNIIDDVNEVDEDVDMSSPRWIQGIVSNDCVP